MTNIINTQRNTTELVETYIGTAYDVVKGVYDNLGAILGLVDQSNKWQGEFEVAPQLRVDGTALQGGDAYYNLKTKRTYTYVITGTACPIGMWVDALGVHTGVEVHTIAAGNIVGGDTIISLDGSYTPHTNNMMVVVGGSFQNSQSNDPSGAYVETNSQTITFPGIVLQIGEIVTVMMGVPLTTGNAVISVKSMDNLSGMIGVDGDRINVGAFYEGNGLGGGTFDWIPDKDATEHNGGTIVSPDVTAVAGSSGWYVAPVSGTGCWVRKETTVFDATWFGIRLNGTTESDDALAALVTHGIPACIPVGTYEVNSVIVGDFFSFGTTTVTGTGSVTITNLLAP